MLKNKSKRDSLTFKGQINLPTSRKTKVTLKFSKYLFQQSAHRKSAVFISVKYRIRLK